MKKTTKLMRRESNQPDMFRRTRTPQITSGDGFIRRKLKMWELEDLANMYEKAMKIAEYDAAKTQYEVDKFITMATAGKRLELNFVETESKKQIAIAAAEKARAEATEATCNAQISMLDLKQRRKEFGE